MNSTTLKLFAIIAMLLDHIGTVLYPQVIIFKLIGRLAFPIFCFFIAEGYLKTRNKKKYMLRLFICALISQIPFTLVFRQAFGESFFALNTIFDLFLGLVAIYLYDNSKSKYRIAFVWVIAIAAFFLRIDGDFTGVFSIYFFFKYHDSFKDIVKNQIFLILMSQLAYSAYMLLLGVPVQYLLSLDMLMQLLAILALIPIKLYNGEKGFNIKYLFYAFYPVHLSLLYLIKIM
ncbi:MAG: TraX family protein [Clostridiaceae bacterium]